MEVLERVGGRRGRHQKTTVRWDEEGIFDVVVGWDEQQASRWPGTAGAAWEVDGRGRAEVEWGTM